MHVYLCAQSVSTYIRTAYVQNAHLTVYADIPVYIELQTALTNACAFALKYKQAL